MPLRAVLTRQSPAVPCGRSLEVDAASILSPKEDRPLSEDQSTAEGELALADGQALLAGPVTAPLFELEFDASGDVDVDALLAAVAALRPLPVPAAPPAAAVAVVELSPPASAPPRRPPAAVTATRACDHCHLALSAGVRFCRRCGTRQPALT